MENAYKIVEQLYKSNQLELALSKAQQIVDENPQNFETWTIIGSIYGQLKDFQKSVKILQKSLLINENQVLAHKSLGYAYLQLHQTDLANEHLLKSLVFDSNDAFVYYQLGCINISLEKYDIALQYFNRGLRYDQKNVRIYLEKAQCFSLQKKNHLAIRTYQIIIKLEPNLGETYRRMGLSYSRLFEYQLALEYYVKAIQIDPNDIEAYWLQGINYYRQNLLYMANVNFDKVLQLNYKHQQALEYFIRIKFTCHVLTEREQYKKLDMPKQMLQYQQAGQVDLVDYFHALFYTLSHFINGYLHLDLTRNDSKYQKVCAMVQNFINTFLIHKEQEEPLIAVFYDELEDILQMNEKQIKEKLDKWLQEDYLKQYKLIELNEVLAKLCLEKSINKQEFTLKEIINFRSLTEYPRYYSVTSQVALSDALDTIYQILK